MSTTLKEVAALAGVSSATASRVLSGHRATSAASRAAVVAAARKLNFLPNGQARSLRLAKTHTIGLLIPDLRNPYFADLAHTVEQEARQHGLVSLMGSANEDPAQQDEFLKLFLSRNIDGLILVPQGLAHESDAVSSPITLLQERGVPTVFMDRVPTRQTQREAPSITADTQGMREALTHLHTLGHRRIALLAGPQETSTGYLRRAAFEDTCRELGLPVAPVWQFLGDFRLESGERGARYFLDRYLMPGSPGYRERPTALIIADGPMTIGALRTFGAAGLRIPEELSVIGYDDIAAYSLHSPALSTVSHASAAMGRLALETLHQLIAGQPAESVVLPTRLTVRSSTAAPAPDTASPASTTTTNTTSTEAQR